MGEKSYKVFCEPDQVCERHLGDFQQTAADKTVDDGTLFYLFHFVPLKLFLGIIDECDQTVKILDFYWTLTFGLLWGKCLLRISSRTLAMT